MESHSSPGLHSEISVLGITSDLKPFCDATNLPKIPKDTIAQLSRDAIACTFEIYKKRNNYAVHSDKAMNQLIMQSTPVLTLVYLITTSYTVYACLVLILS